ncbi:MAG: hypothetical protein JWM46_157 [Candidatus Kaiserbacteria bacterium]|nr:hypothetical protein [Candidatus Kaiserbacteria bacterium]
MAKYRSIDPEYIPQIIKEYGYWTLSIHDDQRYLGRSYLWLVREGGMQRLSELTADEYAELKMIMTEYEAALKALWNPDHMNYSWLGNLIAEHGGHGHMHLIPRYKEDRVLRDITFNDGRWGKNCSPHEPYKIEQPVLFEIRDALKQKLS